MLDFYDGGIGWFGDGREMRWARQGTPGTWTVTAVWGGQKDVRPMREERIKQLPTGRICYVDSIEGRADRHLFISSADPESFRLMVMLGGARIRHYFRYTGRGDRESVLRVLGPAIREEQAEALLCVEPVSARS